MGIEKAYCTGLERNTLCNVWKRQTTQKKQGKYSTNNDKVSFSEAMCVAEVGYGFYGDSNVSILFDVSKYRRRTENVNDSLKLLCP